MKVFVEIKKCDECPFVEIDRTEGAGYAVDYFCKKSNGRKIAGYVEYQREIPDVPNWCPFKTAE